MNRRSFLRIAGVVPLLGVAGDARAAVALIYGIRMWSAPDHTRLVFDLEAPTTYRLRGAEGRLVIDFASARPALALDAPIRNDSRVVAVDAERLQGDGFRIALKLRRSVRAQGFLLPPNAEYGHRLVIDLYDQKTDSAAPRPTPMPRPQRRDLVVAIDAGHGGEDPGARGSRKTEEKEVALAIARRLALLIEREPGMRPFLVRDGDYYVGLRRRIRKARRRGADLFLSIHADAAHRATARGASVFILSSKGASSEMARWLEQRENSADLIGGVALEEREDDLAATLLDMTQSANRRASRLFAEAALARLGRIGALHGKEVQRAAFVVLKAPDIPSILVETGFITNPQEETRLRNPAHQQRIADALLQAIRDFARRSPLANATPTATPFRASPGAKMET